MENYCELNFFKKFFTTSADQLDETKEEVYRFLEKKYFAQKRVVYLNLTSEEAQKQINNDPIVTKLMNLHNSSRINLQFKGSFEGFINDTKHLQSARNINPHSIFFVDKKAMDCQEWENKYGFYAFSTENYLERWGILSKESKKMTYDHSSDWRMIEKIQHPFNSLLIFDKYMFNQAPTHIEKSLNDLLLHLIAEKENEIPIQITLVFKDLLHSLVLKDIEDMINDCLKRNRPKLKYKVQIARIIKADDKFHTRFIVTNYFGIHPYSGITITPETKKEDLTFNPLTFSDEKETISQYLKDVIPMLDNSKNKIGLFSNRLLLAQSTT